MEEFKPKVFISYTWSSDDYIMKVSQFVNRLVSDGVDVLFDQYEMKPGKSLNNYMEKCVSDSSVTNVLILLNPDYKTKADTRTGGAGIETQIISTEVYQNLDNEKFIPILFDKMGKDANSCVPTYLKDRYRLDLSDVSHYEEMYMAVLRTIYKKPAFVKPALGERPSWLDNKDDELNYDIAKTAKIREMIQRKDNNLKRYVLDMLHKDLLSIPFLEMKLNSCDDFEPSYSLFFKFRNQYIVALNEMIEDVNLEDFIFDLFADIDSQIGYDTADLYVKNTYLKILKHELIVETVSILFKNQKYSVIGSLIGRTYISGKQYECQNFEKFFYCLSNTNIYNLDKQLGHKYGDGKSYKLTGIGDYWIRHLPEPFINRDDFAFADVLISNLSIAITNKGYSWFALTYVYIVNENSWLRRLASSLKSQKLTKIYLPLFDCSNLEDLKICINNIKDFDEKKSYRFGYNECFNSIELLSKYIKCEEIGSLK